MQELLNTKNEVENIEQVVVFDTQTDNFYTVDRETASNPENKLMRVIIAYLPMFRDKKGDLYTTIAQRSFAKKELPGYWSFPAAGHVNNTDLSTQDQTLDIIHALNRETEEELGYTASQNILIDELDSVEEKDNLSVSKKLFVALENLSEKSALDLYKINSDDICDIKNIKIQKLIDEINIDPTQRSLQISPTLESFLQKFQGYRLIELSNLINRRIGDLFKNDDFMKELAEVIKKSQLVKTAEP